jgi:hypothetical protein
MKLNILSPLTLDPDEARRRSLHRVYRVLLDAAIRAELNNKTADPVVPFADGTEPAEATPTQGGKSINDSNDLDE